MLVTNRIPAQRKDTIAPMHVTAIALSQVRGSSLSSLVFLVFWAKLRREEEWMRSQSGETYATYAHETVGQMDGRLWGCSGENNAAEGDDLCSGGLMGAAG